MKNANYTKSCERQFRRTVLLASIVFALPVAALTLNADYYMSIILHSQIVLHLCHFLKTVVPSTFNLIFLLATLCFVLLVPTGILRSLYHIVQGITFPTLLKPRTVEISPVTQRKQKQAGGYRVIEIDSHVPFAFARGIFDKKIVVSRSLNELLSPDEYDAVLKHEAGHLVMNHPIKRLLLSSILRSFFLLPSRKLTWQKFRHLTELAADEFAVREGVMPAVLASAIVKVARHDRTVKASPATGFSDSRVKERVHALLGSDGGMEYRGCEKRPKLSSMTHAAFALLLLLFLMQPFLGVADSRYCMNHREGANWNLSQVTATFSICTERNCQRCDVCSPAHRTHQKASS